MSSSDGAHATPHLAHHFDTIEKQDYAVRLGMWLFLGTEVLLFAGLFLGYTVYRHFYYEAFHEASRHLDLWAAWESSFSNHSAYGLRPLSSKYSRSSIAISSRVTYIVPPAFLWVT